MSKMKNVVIVVAVLVAVGAVLAIKEVKRDGAMEEALADAQQVEEAVAAGDAGKDAAVSSAVSEKIPKLVDLGAGKCIPCKMMAPILEELKKEYAGKFDVQFIDVWQEPDVGKPYEIRVIPTQIFYDAAGKERFRHEGFFGKEDILAKWKELGVNLAGAAASPGVSRRTR